MTIEELIVLQELGARACNHGKQSWDNPFLAPDGTTQGDAVAHDDWLARHDAWKFGGDAENASHGGVISEHFKMLLSGKSK